VGVSTGYLWRATGTRDRGGSKQASGVASETLGKVEAGGWGGARHCSCSVRVRVRVRGDSTGRPAGRRCVRAVNGVTAGGDC
jgi:hypothetical protein